MARRPREAPPAPGLLASAFSYVTREIESFVTAATGGDVQKVRSDAVFQARAMVGDERSAAVQTQTQTQDQPEASSSRVTLDGKRRRRDEGRADREKEKERDWERERERRAKRVRKRSEVESDRARARRRLREEVEGDRATKLAKKKSTQNIREERDRSSEREAADDEDGKSPSVCWYVWWLTRVQTSSLCSPYPSHSRRDVKRGAKLSRSAERTPRKLKS